MKVVIASDHRALDKKKFVCDFITKMNHSIVDLGPFTDESTDYPIYAKKVCDEIINNNAKLGILFCGTGIGMSIAANKIRGIRCAKVSNKQEAILAKLHNNSNVIALSSALSKSEIKKIIKSYLETEFSNEERHIKRLEMIENND